MSSAFPHRLLNRLQQETLSERCSVCPSSFTALRWRFSQKHWALLLRAMTSPSKLLFTKDVSHINVPSELLFAAWSQTRGATSMQYARYR